MISLHYTSHTKAYNTIYTACNIVEAIYSFTQVNALSTPYGSITIVKLQFDLEGKL